MKLPDFKLENYLERFEFSAPYLMCCSDAQSWKLQEVLDMASHDDQKLWDDLTLQYTHVKGMPELREAIACNLYDGLKSKNILCFAGAEEGIFCTLTALLQPNDHVIVVTPCYQSLFEIPKAIGCKITTISLEEKTDWKIQVNQIKKAIQANTKCVIINSPHNPTGQIIDQKELNELIPILDQHGIWLFCDEVYRLLGESNITWAPSPAVLYHRAISIGVMTKAFGMAGLRIGWMAGQDIDILEKARNIKQYTSICNSGLSEVVALIALKNKDYILRRNNQIIDKNLKLLDDFFVKYSNKLSWVKPRGGCVGLVKYEGDVSSDEFCKKALQETGVLLMPGSIFDVSGNYFRVGFGRENMPEALENFERFVGQVFDLQDITKCN